MKYLFAALRFFEDGNLSDRAYWYLCDFPVKAGEEVFAPVGMRNRLQKGRVERTVAAEEENAPYDVALCKHVAAKCGDRKREADGFLCYELGGVPYDEKRYTAFGRVLISEEKPQTLSVLEKLGVKDRIDADDAEEALRALAGADGRALVCGKGARDVAAALYSLVRGGAEAFAEEYRLSADEISALARKLL